MFHDESELLDRALDGDQAACASLYDRTAPVVLSLCRRSGLDSLTDAEDATQETFIRAFRQLHTLERRDRFRPWLYRIAHFVCSEKRRASRRRHQHEDVAMTMASIQHESTSGPDVEHAESMSRLGAAIDQLDERERLALHLYYLEADPVHAAQHALGLSRSAYYKLLARARDRLASILREVSPS